MTNRLRLRPKNKKKKNRVPLRPKNLLLLLLLLLLTMATTYTVAANDLEGVIIRFAPHPVTDFPFLHHTLNGVCGVDLYETDFHFLFSDIAANGQTELYKDAPKRLLAYMINRIKTVSAAAGTGTRSNTAKVDELFGKMLFSYRTKANKTIHF